MGGVSGNTPASTAGDSRFESGPTLQTLRCLRHYSPDKLTAGKDRPPGLAIPAVIWGSRSAADHLRPESVRWFRGRRESAVRIRPAPPMPKPGLALRLGFTLPRGLHRDRAISSTFFLTAGKDRPVAGGIPLPEFGPLDASSSETAKPDGNTDAGQPIVFGT